MDALIQLYNWSPKHEMLTSQYGTIHCLEWMRREKARIERTPGRVAEIMESGSRCALFVNDVSNHA